MEPLTTRELEAIVACLNCEGKYAPNGNSLILEIYGMLVFSGAYEKYKVDDNLIKEKLEYMQAFQPQQFKNLYDKLEIIVSTRLKEDEILPRLAEVELI